LLQHCSQHLTYIVNVIYNQCFSFFWLLYSSSTDCKQTIIISAITAIHYYYIIILLPDCMQPCSWSIKLAKRSGNHWNCTWFLLHFLYIIIALHCRLSSFTQLLQTDFSASTTTACWCCYFLLFLLASLGSAASWLCFCGLLLVLLFGGDVTGTYYYMVHII